MEPVRQRSNQSAKVIDLNLDGQKDELATFTPPSFTVKDLLSAIPSHCFERSALRSSLYILMDLVFLSLIVYSATFINGLFGFNGTLVQDYPGLASRYLAWAAYAFVAALPGTGLWVIAHECGHQAFSPSKTINNSVGWVLHSLLLVPYHSWRISHGKHHAATGHMTRDQVFVPKTRSQRNIPSQDELSTMEKVDELLEDAPLYVFINVLLQQVFGWPMYLLTNASGQRFQRWTNHFDPESPIFDRRHWLQIITSDAGLLMTISMLATWSHYRGFLEVFRFFLGPYLWVNSNLVLITYLQHTDPQLPHYREGEWNFQRGALCTIDRSYFGFFLHGISETHVLHHVCSKIPHYHAWEASEALKRVLGDYYMKSDENPFITLFKNFSTCRFVEDEGECIFYKDARGNASRKVVWDAPISDSGIDCL